jgi:hypothetical protein
MLEGRTEEFSLTSRRNAGNNNDHSGVQRFLSVQRKKIGPIVGYKCVVVCANCRHELPVFRAAEPEIIDMICQVTRRMRYFDQGCVQAFIDQKLHFYPARARPCRVARIGFRFAQGREIGRPRRGKAWT